MAPLWRAGWSAAISQFDPKNKMSKLSSTAILALVASASALQPVLDTSLTIDQEFDTWASVYGKFYETEELKAQRKQVFQANRETVISHNEEFEKGIHSFNLELNHLADLTNKEYRDSMLGFESKISTTAGQTFKAKNGTVPTFWDWRTNATNVVGAVKNQGSCGSCWAFSAVATMEGAYNQKTGKVNSFSEQELVDCTNGGANTCSLGGQMYQGIEYAIANGIMAETDYPYKGSSGHACAFDKTKSIHQFSSYTNITSGDENALKTATYEKPIISVGIDASSIWFQLYFGGVFDVKSCKNTEDQLDHGVSVVGYGTDPKSKKDYWTVRNSWGGFWGMKGYILMVRNKDNQCGVATQACFADL